MTSQTDTDDDPPTRFEKFRKLDAEDYEKTNALIRDRTRFTAAEWAVARLCADFRTETGIPMTTVGEQMPDLVPFVHDEYSRGQVNQHRARFEEKVREAAATFLYGAMCDFFTAEELDDIMHDGVEIAKYMLELEGADLGYEAEIQAEEQVKQAMREVREASHELRTGADDSV